LTVGERFLAIHAGLLGRGEAHNAGLFEAIAAGAVRRLFRLAFLGELR
jgi:hypothetical protein